MRMPVCLSGRLPGCHWKARHRAHRQCMTGFRAARYVGVSHAAVEVNRLTANEFEWCVAIGVQLKFAVDDVEKFLALIPHELPDSFRGFATESPNNGRDLLFEQ